MIQIEMQLTEADLNNIKLARSLLIHVTSGDEDDRARIEDALHFIECILMEYGGIK